MNVTVVKDIWNVVVVFLLRTSWDLKNTEKVNYYPKNNDHCVITVPDFFSNIEPQIFRIYLNVPLS